MDSESPDEELGRLADISGHELRLEIARLVDERLQELGIDRTPPRLPVPKRRDPGRYLDVELPPKVDVQALLHNSDPHTIEELNPEAYEPSEQDTREKALGAMAVLRTEIIERQQKLDQFAQLARAAGASWSEIGRAAEITPQSAHQRWSPQGLAKHRNYMRRYGAKP